MENQQQQQVTCELNGIKYLIVDVPVTHDNYDTLNGVCEKYEVICQGLKKLKLGGLFSRSIMVTTLLVPEKNVIAFNSNKF